MLFIEQPNLQSVQDRKVWGEGKWEAGPRHACLGVTEPPSHCSRIYFATTTPQSSTVTGNPAGKGGEREKGGGRVGCALSKQQEWPPGEGQVHQLCTVLCDSDGSSSSHSCLQNSTAMSDRLAST